MTTLGYGIGLYGNGPYGGPSATHSYPARLVAAVSLSGVPYLVSATPAPNSVGASPTVSVSFTVGSVSGVDVRTLIVFLAGNLAIMNGSFVSGYAGTIVNNGDGSVSVTISMHPPFVGNRIDVYINVASL